MLSVNIMGTALMSRFASEYMKQAGGGAIVNLGSISSFVAQSSFITYSSTKGAILQMTRRSVFRFAIAILSLPSATSASGITAFVRVQSGFHAIPDDRKNIETV